MIYFILLAFIAIATYQFDYLKKRRNRQVCYYVILLALILVAGFRYRVGLDTVRYESQYEYIPSIDEIDLDDFNNNAYDPLYLLLASISKTISSEFWVLQLLHALLVNVIVFRFIKLNTENIFFGVLCYYLFLYINFMCEVMREACAVSMLLLGWEYLKKEKIFKFSIFCILAYGFHTSAFILLLFPILNIIKVWNYCSVNKYTPVLLIFVLIFGYYIQHLLFDYLLLLDVSTRFSNKVEAYSDNSLSQSVLNIKGIISTTIKFILYPFTVRLLMQYNNIRYFYKQIDPLLICCFCAAMLSIPIALLYRYNNYFMLFAIIVLCQIVFYKGKIYISKRKFIKLNSFLTWTIIFFPLFFFTLIGYYSRDGRSPYRAYVRYYPYSSIFGKETDMTREKLFNYYDAR